MAVSAEIIHEYAEKLDNTTEQLQRYGQLSLEACRRAAFGILGEDIMDMATYAILREMYAPGEGEFTRAVKIVSQPFGPRPVIEQPHLDYGVLTA